jgi:DNA-binding beta-propeller fold protein YncE
VDRRAFVVGAAGLAFAPGAFARRLGGTPLALVTADLEEHVAAVEIGSGRIVKRIPTLAGPRAIDSPTVSTAVVAHTSEGALSIIDAVALKVRRVIRGFGEPRYVATAHGFAYVTDSARGEVVVVDLSRGRIVHRVDVGGPARHVTVHASARRLWTALGSEAEQVAVLDLSRPAHPRLLRKITPPYLAHDVGFTPTGRRVWVTSGNRKTFGVYDARSHELLYRRPSGAPPQHVTFIGARAYVTSGDDGTLDVHALPAGARQRRTRIPAGSFNVQAYAVRLGINVVLTPSLSQGTLCVVDRAGKVQRHVRVARSSHDACFVVSA